LQSKVEEKEEEGCRKRKEKQLDTVKEKKRDERSRKIEKE
jgi:hypothetical protein